jgi:lysophospholipid acyltransferase (LPLAT)-like uncharacterized protein
MLKRLLRRPALRAALVGLLGHYLAFALRSTRWKLLGAEHLPTPSGPPVIAAFWHEGLALMPALWTEVHRRGERRAVHVLVSRHSDGRVIGAMLQRFGVAVVHGSSARGGQDRGGAAGLRALAAVLAGGGHVAITPDGPRGPRRVAAPGVAHLAALSGAMVLPMAAQTGRRRVLRSWDRMVLPLPWGRGVICCGPPVAVPREDWLVALPAISAAMDACSAHADAACL